MMPNRGKFFTDRETLARALETIARDVRDELWPLNELANETHNVEAVMRQLHTWEVR